MRPANVGRLLNNRRLPLALDSRPSGRAHRAVPHEPLCAILSLKSMTKVQLRYSLLRPLDDELMKRISDAHAIYGIERIQVAPTLDTVLVEFDASRLTRNNVEATLHVTGIPVRPLYLPHHPHRT